MIVIIMIENYNGFLVFIVLITNANEENSNYITRKVSNATGKPFIKVFHGNNKSSRTKEKMSSSSSIIQSALKRFILLQLG